VRLVTELLAASGLGERAALFAREEIDAEALLMMDEPSLQRLGLKFGPRAKTLKLIKEVKLCVFEAGNEEAAVRRVLDARQGDAAMRAERAERERAERERAERVKRTRDAAVRVQAQIRCARARARLRARLLVTVRLQSLARARRARAALRAARAAAVRLQAVARRASAGTPLELRAVRQLMTRAREAARLRDENAKLRDENARLRGESEAGRGGRGNSRGGRGRGPWRGRGRGESAADRGR